MSLCKSVYTKWAFEVLYAYFEYRQPTELPDMEKLKNPAGCFVTLHNSNGTFRGCIGTIDPQQKNLREEIHTNALSAALNDPRFPALCQDELDNLSISVDVLQASERVDRLDELNPSVYGVIVQSGFRRGVLLPDLDGIETVEQQIDIALQKAGIRKDEPYHLFRFKVDRFY